MKTSTKLVSSLTVLCGTLLLASGAYAQTSESGSFTKLVERSSQAISNTYHNLTGNNDQASISNAMMMSAPNVKNNSAEQVDPLQLIVTPIFPANAGGANIRCGGQSTGSVTTGASGGVGPYTWTWSHNSAWTASNAGGLSAGAYWVKITDATGASVTHNYTITQNPVLLATPSVTPIACYGGQATINVTSTGGVAPYSGWNTYTVTPGTYSYTIFDNLGCRNTQAVVITQPAILEASASNTAIYCYGNASTVTVAATGGTLPYTGTGTFTQYAGTTTYPITDANGCTVNVVKAVNQPGMLSTMANYTPISCYGGTSQVTVTVFSGTEPYTGTGVFTEYAGSHTYDVTDSYGCPDQVTITIPQPPMISPSISSTAIACHGGSSTVTVSATGGTGSFSGTGTFNVGAGSYTYNVSDANNCVATVATSITQPTQLTAASSNTAILCKGGASTVTVTAAGGTAPYTGTGNFTAAAGTSNFTVTDANGCTSATAKSISEPTQIMIAHTQTGTIQCFGQTASLNVTATGGTGPYTGTGVITGVTAGPRVINVSDANGCLATKTVTVAGATQLLANIAQPYKVISCIPHPVTFTANASGGTAPYTYSWSNGSTSSTISVNPNVNTSYDVTITDAGGCTRTITNAATVAVENRCGSNNQKIVICHVPSGNNENPQTICISPNALDPHMSDLWNLHGGDYCGPCLTTMSLTLDEQNNGDNNYVRVGMNTNNETVELSYRLGYDSDVRVEIYDMTGAMVEVIHQSKADEGQMYDFVITPSKFSSGVYIYQFITDTETHIDKMQFIH